MGAIKLQNNDSLYKKYLVFSTVVYIYAIQIWGKKTLEWYTEVISVVTSGEEWVGKIALMMKGA